MLVFAYKICPSAQTLIEMKTSDVGLRMLVLLERNLSKFEHVGTDNFKNVLREIGVEPFKIATTINGRKLLFAGRVSNPKPQR